MVTVGVGCVILMRPSGSTVEVQTQVSAISADRQFCPSIWVCQAVSKDFGLVHPFDELRLSCTVRDGGGEGLGTIATT